MIPSPLHPALVHFPIALLLVGAMAAVAAAFLRRWHLPLGAAILLGLGALGALAAVQTGETEGGLAAGMISEPAEQMLDEHEDWAETTRSLAIVAALLAVASASLGRFPRTARVAGAAAALAALCAAYAVAETGHRGGQLVYKYGVGINLAAGQPDKSSASPAAKGDDD